MKKFATQEIFDGVFKKSSQKEKEDGDDNNDNDDDKKSNGSLSETSDIE